MRDRLMRPSHPQAHPFRQFHRPRDRFRRQTRRCAGFPCHHGPNEAGKSTLFAAWLDFLYGIEERSPYNFIHDHAMMQVGAVIEDAQGSTELIRVKKRQASLLDADEQRWATSFSPRPCPDSTATPTGTCSPSTRIRWKPAAMRSSKSKGDLGQLLFSASAGLADLSVKPMPSAPRRMPSSRPAAGPTTWAELKQALKDLKDEAGAASMSPPRIMPVSSTSGTA